jgi:hypothetical protein
MSTNDQLKLLEYEKYRQALYSCGNMTYYQLKELLDLKENAYTFGNLLSIVIQKAPTDLIRLYDRYIQKNN